MWIFTKERGAFNLDNYDRIAIEPGGTVLIKTGCPACFVSNNDVREKIAIAIRNGDNFVEVD